MVDRPRIVNRNVSRSMVVGMLAICQRTKKASLGEKRKWHF
jgi:hypothetical protein